MELKPITLFFGPNSAGKRTIVQALHYAREIFERHNLNPDKTIVGGNFIELGGLDRLAYRPSLRTFLYILAGERPVGPPKSIEIHTGLHRSTNVFLRIHFRSSFQIAADHPL